jgi:N-acetyl-gamma-glutamyl-phosphate reductase
MPKVGILGATGYTGLELIKILHRHPSMEIGFLGSVSSVGKKVKEVFPFLEGFDIGDYTFGNYESIPSDVELLFLALPHEVSMELVPKLLKEGYKVVDLSGAYRFKRLEDYKTFYGFEHKYPEILESAVYGLPEFFREQIKSASLVANPGCYPTATLLALYPLLTKGRDYIKDDTVIVHALSGVSGAGRSPKQQFHFPEMTDNMFSYKVLKHRHIPEMEYVCQTLSGVDIKIRFTPTVVPIDRGMASTVYVKSEKFEILDLYKEVYKNETFVRVIGQPPQSKWVANTNYCYIYPAYDERTETVIVISAIDNLVKGASGQAVQNANLMLGLDEKEGLTEPLPGLV